MTSTALVNATISANTTLPRPRSTCAETTVTAVSAMRAAKMMR